MKQLVLKADLLIKNTQNEHISISNKDGNLIINFDGRSVPKIPKKWLWTARKFVHLNKHIAHPIIVNINGKTLYYVDSENIILKDYLLGLRILFKSFFTT
jgi:hypothetical protein